MQHWRSLSGIVWILGATGCFPEVPYEAGKVGSVDTGALSVGDDGGAGGMDDGGDDGGSDGGDDGGSDGGDDGGSGDGGGEDAGGTGTEEDCLLYADVDGDGYGAGEGVLVDCDASGYSETADDCDDSDVEVHPDASERCNGVDDDCDSSIDEDLSYEWYVDADADGFGGGESLDTCDPPEGAVDVAGDCDDGDADVNPDASEVCNGYDDDCDELVDDADDSTDLAASGTSYYPDADGDGFGDPDGEVVACDAPDSDHVVNADDCDDGVTEVNPDATEVCDGIDNDCDLAIDDDDPSLDLTTASEWHDDTDMDGFGAVAVAATTCVAPSGMVADNTDCDDGEADVNPAATEVCNAIDDDCDTLVDDDDASVDTSTGSAFYTDADGDGYGDPSTEVYACTNPGSLVADSTDCDDDDGSVSPAGTEVCNGVDDDCDTLIDDDDSSLDLSTGTTWYTDSDGDGYGVSTSTTVACEMPSGFADNADDCDDSGFDDLDGDLIQDCEDSDADGDGLSSTFDADDLDDSIVRGPTGGTGIDGALSISGTSGRAWEDFTLLASDGAEGDSNIAVDSVSSFSDGDELLIFDVQGADAGSYGFYYVTGISGSTLELEPPLQNDFDAADVVIVQRVPQFTTVAISGTVTPDAWDGSGGGLVVFRATGAVNISGEVDVSGLGYMGGKGVAGHASDPTTGGTWSTGPSAASSSGASVDGGGGAMTSQDDSLGCGGGGAYGTDGGAGDYLGGTNSSSPGTAYGDSDLSQWFFGSGGGGGAPDAERDGDDSDNVSGDGGAGGGLVAIYSATSITIAGGIYADGDSGEDAYFTGSWRDDEGEIGGGGGGAGGQVLLVADSVAVTGEVSAMGGDGGMWNTDYFWSFGYGFGGDGGDGRTRIEYTTVSGDSLVTPSPSTGTFID